MVERLATAGGASASSEMFGVLWVLGLEIFRPKSDYVWRTGVTINETPIGSVAIDMTIADDYIVSPVEVDHEGHGC